MKCSNVVISLDGRKEVHDHLRKNYAGQGSYDMIIPEFQEFARRRGDRDYYVRGTYTHNNVDFTKDIFHMADLGFRSSIEPVVAPPEAPYALQERTSEFVEYERLATEMLERKREGKGRDFTFYHYMIDLTGGPCIVKRISGCGVGRRIPATPSAAASLVISSSVKRTSCGKIYDGITDSSVCDQFKCCNIYSHEEC